MDYWTYLKYRFATDFWIWIVSFGGAWFLYALWLLHFKFDMWRARRFKMLIDEVNEEVKNDRTTKP